MQETKQSLVHLLLQEHKAFNPYNSFLFSKWLLNVMLFDWFIC